MLRNTAVRIEDRLQRTNDRPWVWFVVIFCLLAMQVKWWWAPGDDGMGYLSVARHLSAGELERFGIGHMFLAPGFPLLIAPVFWFSDYPFLLISIVQFFLSVAFCAGIYVWFRRLAPQAAAMLTVLVMVNVSYWHFQGLVLSENAFLAELVWASYVLLRVTEAGLKQTPSLVDTQQSSFPWNWIAAAICLVTMTVYTRHVGVFLLGGFAFILFLQAWQNKISWKRMLSLTALVSVPVVIFLFALVVWDREMALAYGPEIRSYGEYFDEGGMSPVAQVFEGLRLRLSECGRLLIPGMYKAYSRSGEWLHVNTILYAAFSMAIVVAWYKIARRSVDPLLFMLPIYVGFYLVWPFDQGTRYLLPVLPVLVLAFWELLSFFEKRRYSVLMCLILLHTAVAVNYWIRDLQDYQFHQYWSVVKQVTKPLSTNGKNVAAYNIDDALGHMLSYELNYPICRYHKSPEVEAQYDWLIIDEQTSAVPNFAERYRAGSLRLLERIATTAEHTHPHSGPTH